MSSTNKTSNPPPTLAKSQSSMARDEEADPFVIPPKYAMSMMMFQMASGGKNVITLPQITNMLAMPFQMGSTMANQMLDGLFQVGPLKSAPPVVQNLIKTYVPKLENNIRNNLDKMIAPIFSIVDANNSGTISKKEFFHLARIGEFIKSNMNTRGPTSPSDLKEVMEMIYDLVDVNGDGAISKKEIAGLLQRVFLGIGKVPQVILQIFSDTLDQAFFDTIAKAGFDFLPLLSSMGIDITDEKGNIMYTKIAPFLAMGDGLVKMKAQQALATQPQLKTQVDAYLKMEKEYLEKLEKLADSNGDVSKDDYIKLVNEYSDTMVDTIQDQYTTALASFNLNSNTRKAVMLFSGFVDPPTLVKKVLKAKPFVLERTLSTVFEVFGTNGKINTGSLRAIFNCIAGAADPRIQDADPAKRLKAVFDLLDTDKDGTLCATEAAKLVCGIYKSLFAFLGELILLYLRMLTEDYLVVGALSTVEALSDSQPLKIKFPIKKSYIEGEIAKLMGHVRIGDTSRMDKLKSIFAFCDKDGDGMLTLEEFNSISTRVGAAQFSMMCAMGGADPNKIDFDAFAKQYQNGMDLEKDYQATKA